MKAKALCAAIAPLVIVGGYCLWSGQTGTSAEASGSGASPAALETAAATAEKMSLAGAIEQKAIAAEFVGNGRDRLVMLAMNKGSVPLKISVPAGQTFENERSLVVVVRQAEFDIAPGRTAELTVQTAATHSSNKVGKSAFQLSQRTVPRIELLLSYVQQHADLSAPTIQTAILAMTDNLPLSAVAKFTMAGGALPSRFNTDPFRAETQDIIAALSVLKDLGIKDYHVAMTVDPQLRIEAMIDPTARASAMRYYGIAPETEWDFWKNELLSGEPATRHYALYGIARFYPDVAMEMLPRWVRETRTNPVYRLSAAQALADTQKPEALPILRQLVDELGETTELGKAADLAAEHLDYRLAQLAATKNAVAFRTSSEQQARF